MPSARNSDALVAAILKSFDLKPTKARPLTTHLSDLHWVLRKNYLAVVRDRAADGSLPLRELERYARSRFRGFNDVPMDFQQMVSCVTNEPSVAVRMSPYGKPGHPLRGFYHREPDDRQVIWLNLCHVPTAVAATLGHEVGHLVWEEIQRQTPPGTYAFFNSNFAAHLNDPCELFADAFTTIAAYPTTVARTLFSRRGWPRSLRGLRMREDATVANVYEHIRRVYGADLSSTSGLPSPRRFHYIISMIHYSKVRAAILHVAGF